MKIQPDKMSLLTTSKMALTRGKLELRTAWMRLAAFVVQWKDKVQANAPASELKHFSEQARNIHFTITVKDGDPLVSFWKRYKAAEEAQQTSIESGHGLALRLADRYVEQPGGT